MEARRALVLRARRLALASAALCALAGCTSHAPSRPSGEGGPTSVPPTNGPAVLDHTLWIISPGHLHALEQGGMSMQLARSLFDNPRTYLNVGANGASVTEAGVQSLHATYPSAHINWLFNSFGTNASTGAPGLEAVLSGNGVPAGITSIQYDPESGSTNGTPQNEQSALETGDLTFVAQAGSLAHRRGYTFIFSPSVDVGMTHDQAAYPMKYTTFLDQKRGSWAGTPGVDIFCIQSQQAEGTSYYANFVQQAVAQARAAAPHVSIVVGIGINPSHPATAITAADIQNAFDEATAAGAEGFWNNVETGGANVSPSVYVTFFEQLSTSGGTHA